jgi:TetR/AcrR family transcriptional regulator
MHKSKSAIKKKKFGKRLRRAAEVSKEIIINAAIQEFALKGFDGARVDEVARRSGINKTLLYYHIGNKDRLFTAALEATYKTIRIRQKEFSIDKITPEEGVQRLIKLLMSIWVDYPEIGRLLSNANFLGGRHVRQSKLIKRLYSPLLETLNDLLNSGVKKGIFRKGIDAVDLYISISALSAYYISHHHSFDVLFHTDLMNSRRLRQRERHITDMIFRYLLPNPDKAISE